MLAEQRHQRIIEILQENGVVRTTQLAEAMHVSTETIRKDLDALDTEGRLNKVHGGALPKASVSSPAAPAPEPYVPFEARSARNFAPKQRIARAAMAYVHEGGSLALDDGTSGFAVTGVLKTSFHRLTVVTNSLKSAAALVDSRDFTVILSGGIVMADGYSCVSDFATLILEQLTIDVLFLTVSGITAAGLTDQRLEEIRIQQKMIASARKVVVLADSTKFGESSFVRVCGLEDVNVIITDKLPSPEIIEALQEKNCELVIAKED